MSLSTILQHVKKKGQPPPRNVGTKSGPITASSLSSASPSASSTVKGHASFKNGDRKEVDPVVAMLKEKRRLEREKKEQEMRAKKGLPAKKPAKERAPKSGKSATSIKSANGLAHSTNSSRSLHTGRSSNLARSSAYPADSSEQKSTKKLSFNDLMKRASKIDQSKLSITLRNKSKSPETATGSGASSSTVRPVKSKSVTPKLSANPASRVPTRVPDSIKPDISASSAPVRTPLPVRGPSSMLEAKLKDKPTSRDRDRNRNGRHTSRPSSHQYADEYEYDDSDLDSFIASEDDEEERDRYSRHDGQDYDRDEIWAIFNRGKKRNYYNRFDDDSDVDDMEATGADILEEEQASRRRAELEDRRELEEEKRLAALKRARKSKRN
ncbi:hypothetical protein PICST_34006 [Scheffersomyces stipitis CBS 6054]|uniref:SPT2 chromatin protein n=1 Tax=Scheffersomyces stipitis (strain ATCC 58785 / CBS 6054 / NBRC 10063 / NRRL Y-11545) TaxID=322104 RepID=A3GEW0_PICST|nr:predicted protein [Scheffersomyces stipitis CBS 6054]EAZ63236.2 hypothetical protein PICST_34006 [Scheffersomyces stipitis CBS 6054]